MGGHISGRKNADSGQVVALGKSGIGGRAAAERRLGAMAPGVAFKGRILGLHVRWHVNRGLVNPDCSLCVPVTAEGKNA